MKTFAKTLFVLSLSLLGGGALAGYPIYNSIPAPLPPNLPSLGYEATSTDEFGDHVEFAGTNRALRTVVVTLSSWACETGDWVTGCGDPTNDGYYHDLTFNLYAVDNTSGHPEPGALIATRTQDTLIPWRPASDPTCPGGNAWRASNGSCYNGLAFNVTFDFSSLVVTLPDEVIFGLAFDTAHYGANPLGVTGPYDSLNFALSAAATVGTDVEDDMVFWDTSHGPFYCDEGAGGTDTFRRDAGCWAPYVPAAQFNVFDVPANKNECKNGGWMSLFRADRSPFKNQGDCIQYVNTGK